MLKKSFLITFVLLFGFYAVASEKRAVIAFYNVENMFDHHDDPLTNDEEFTPSGRNSWTESRSLQKISNISNVIRNMSFADQKTHGPDILGLAEVENAYVLDRLVSQSAIVQSGYSYIHYDSPDMRGIDVALIYKRASFIPISSKAYQVDLRPMSSRPTRDILYIEGLLKGEKIHFIISHWPSRSGGQAATNSHRAKAAQVAKSIVEKITKKDVKAKIILMGDFNDNPTDRSLVRELGVKNFTSSLSNNDIFNPYYALARKGVGTNAFQDAWSNFDQILISNNLIQKDKGWNYTQAQIYNRKFLIQNTGRYKNYPLRTFNETGSIGYSDHFPVFVTLER